jgi:hypothetical protein
MKLKLYQYILLVLSLGSLAFGVYAVIKNLGFITFLSGIFCGKVTTSFFSSLKTEKNIV